MSRRFLVKIGTQYNDETYAGTSGNSPTFITVDTLEPSMMSVGCNGGMGEFRAFSSQHPEVEIANCADCSPVRLVDTQNGNAVVFDGILYKNHFMFGGGRERFEICAYNRGDDLLDRIVLHGQQRLSYDREEAYWTGGFVGGAINLNVNDHVLIDTALVFNPDGLPNMSNQAYTLSEGFGNTVHTFEKPFRNDTNSGAALIALPWTLNDAVAYLLNFSNANWAIDVNSYNDIALNLVFTGGGGNGNPVISHVNLEGKTLLHGLALLLEPHNYGFFVDPALNGGGSHDIKFFFKGSGGSAHDLVLSPRGINAGASSANAISIDLTHDTSGVVNNVTAYGGRISFTTLCHTNPPANCPTLYQGWKNADLTFPDSDALGWMQNFNNKNFRRRYCNPSLVNPDNGVYGAGRIWLVNLGSVPGQNLEDLTTDLNNNADGANSIDPKVLDKPDLYTKNNPGGLYHQEDVTVEMSVDNGTNWGIVERNWYRLLPNNLGIIFTDPELDLLGIFIKNAVGNQPIGYWQALYNQSLQIRILCTIKSDQKLASFNPNTNNTIPLARERMFENPGYRKVKYNNHAFDALYYTKYTPVQVSVNDQGALDGIVEQQKVLSDKRMVTGTAIMVLTNMDVWNPGDILTSIQNRGAAFAYSAPDAPTIIRVCYDFPAQHVEIAFDSHRTKTIIGNKFTGAQTENERRLGIERPAPVMGGNQVPFLPGAGGIADEIRQAKSGGLQEGTY